jgi:hypothetical protein
VHLLDSFRITTTYRTHVVNIVDSLDLVSKTYVIRATVDTLGISVPDRKNDSRYPVGELLAEMPDSLPLFKVKRLMPTGVHDLRVTAHPNPTITGTEVRFSVPRCARVRLYISNHDGGGSTMLVDEVMDEGRYAVDVSTATLRPGTYIVHVHVDTHVGIAKILVAP